MKLSCIAFTDPFEAAKTTTPPAGLVHPKDIFGEDRVNSRGWDLFDDETLAQIDAARDVPIPDAGPITLFPTMVCSRGYRAVSRDAKFPVANDLYPDLRYSRIGAKL